MLSPQVIIHQAAIAADVVRPARFISVALNSILGLESDNDGRGCWIKCPGRMILSTEPFAVLVDRINGMVREYNQMGTR